MDPIRIAEILNKKPRDKVTATEWNEILQLLVTQGNYLSEQMEAFDQTIQDLINGKLPNITVETNVTSFGGYRVADFVLQTQLNTRLTTERTITNNALALKQDVITLAGNKIVITNSAGKLTQTAIGHEVLAYLEGLNANLIKDVLPAKCWSASRPDQAIYVQQAQPSNPPAGALWVRWD